MGRKRILYVIWSLDLGGAEQVVIHLASNLDPKKFEPMVCCLNTKGRYAASVEQKGIRVFELKKRPKLDLFLIPKLVRLIREEKIDLIHTHLFTANFWGRLVAFFSGVPVVSTEHNMDVWKKWFHFAIDRILARVNTRMIFVSESVMKFYEKRVSRFNGKAKVIYNGIDVERFQNSPHPTLSPSGGEEKGEGAPHVIGIVGRLVPQKGHLDFIEAIRILRLRKKNVVGLIVGDGPFKEIIQSKVMKLGLQNQIIFAGFRDQMAEIYAALDALVLSSSREGFPMTILEAMSAGVPVVATDVGGVSECITNGTDGFLVPVGEPQTIADRVAQVLDDQKLQQEFIKNAGEKVNRLFSVETMVKEHEALYAEILKTNTPSPLPLPLQKGERIGEEDASLRFKVIYVIDHLGMGGAQRQLAELLPLISKERFSVEVISLSTSKKDYAAQIESHGIPVTFIDHQGKWSWRTFFALYKKFLSVKPSIVYTWLFTADLYGELAAFFASVPVRISAMRNTVDELPKRHQIAFRILSRAASAITINAEQIRKELVSELRIPTLKIHTIHNGIDLTRFLSSHRNGHYLEEWKVPAGSKTVAMVARMSHQKDHVTFLEAAQRIVERFPIAHFILVGDGPLRSMIESKVKELGLAESVRILGARYDAWEIVQHVDCCVLATHFEGCSNVILEAMAAGKPVVATDVGGNRELIVDGETGFLIPPKNPMVLANMVLEILENPEKANMIGQRAQNRIAQNFTLHETVRKTEALYLKLLQEKGVFTP